MYDKGPCPTIYTFCEVFCEGNANRQLLGLCPRPQDDTGFIASMPANYLKHAGNLGIALMQVRAVSVYYICRSSIVV